MKSIIIEETLDGSHTLFIPELKEHYHSVNGAVQEAKHVYIDAALNQYEGNEICILELGFGTGLNALLSAIEAKKRNIKLSYIGIEKFPLSSEIIQKLNYADIDQQLFSQIHSSQWELPIKINSNFTIHKINVDFMKYDFPGQYNVVYYDAFAPDKQSEVWSQEVFNHLYSSMTKGGILSTYCAKGDIRRKMKQAGFSVNRIPGPPGKREMLQAVKY